MALRNGALQFAKSVTITTNSSRGGRWAVGAIRGYNTGNGSSSENVSNSSLSNQIQKEQKISTLQLEIDTLRNEVEKRSNESRIFQLELETQKISTLQLQIDTLRNEVKKRSYESRIFQLELETQKLRSAMDKISSDLKERKAVGDELKGEISETSELLHQTINGVKADIKEAKYEMMTDTMFAMLALTGSVGVVALCALW